MFLKILVLVAAVGQVVAAATLSIGTFEQSTRDVPVLIQPAGWAFSIWGLIYTLSFIYAIYQLLPKYDNAVLKATRLPAIIGFTGSGVWLYFAGMSSDLVWMTVVILLVMAVTFTFVVTAIESEDKTTNLFSKYLLLPYAAWAAIACWVNVQSLLVDREVITSLTTNFASNLILFGCLTTFTFYYFKQSSYSAWYGGVMVWASVAVVAANLSVGSIWFAALAGFYAAATVAVFIRHKLRNQVS